MSGHVKRLYKRWYSQLLFLGLSITRDNVKKKLASLFVVPFGKALNGILPPLNGRQVVTTILVIKENYRKPIKKYKRIFGPQALPKAGRG